jgi:hypothetical protein
MFEAAVHIGHAILHAVFHRLLPVKPDAGMSLQEASQIRLRYWWVQIVLALVFVAVTAGAAVGMTLGLVGVQAVRLSALPTSEFVLPDGPVWIEWAVPAFFLGLALGAHIAALCVRFLLGSVEYHRFARAEKLVAGYDTFRLMRYFTACVILVSVPYCTLAMNWYTRFDDRGITVNEFFGFGETFHDYADVTRVLRINQFIAPSGKVVSRPRYLIIFRDGTRWSNEDVMTAHEDPEALKALEPVINFICRMTNRQVEVVQSLEDVGR